MKYLIHTIAFLLLLTMATACGDFYVFEDEPDSWDGVAMRVLCDSNYVMEGDTMPLRVEFTPLNPDSGAVYWYIPDSLTAKIRNNSLIAKSAGELQLVAISNNGRLQDTARVTVFERWDTTRLEYSKINDMVVYANITIKGEQWNPETQLVAAFIDGRLAGVAEAREDFGIKYARLRIWADVEEHAGYVFLQCYDRRRFRLYSMPGFDFKVNPTLGTLSDLYPLNF